MKQVFKNIGILVLLIAFLVSASGFRLIRHTCPSCNLVEYTFHQPEACCGETTPAAGSESGSCCTVPEKTTTCSIAFETTSCCEFDSKYFLVDELISPQKLKVEAPLAATPVVADTLVLVTEEEGNAFLDAFMHPPPPIFSGTDYLFFLHQLKIAFC